jgi:small subunit ribosomal protein S16
MMRIGRRHRPFFRINAIESRNQQKGRVLEKLGHYDPIEKDKDKQVVLNLERVKHWLDVGAVPTDAVSQILLRCGVKTKHGEEKSKRRERAKVRARATGELFTKAERAAAAKAETAGTTVSDKAPEPSKPDEPAAAKAETTEPAESTQPPETTAPAEAEEAKAESTETSTATEATENVKADETTQITQPDETSETAKPDEAKPETPETTESDKAGETSKADEADKTKTES